jgi:mRNA interferase YafQ
MKYTVVYSKQYKKSYQRLLKTGLSQSIDFRIAATVAALAEGSSLDPSQRDHALKGEYAGTRECHIGGDLLLVYKIEKNELILLLVDIGSHAYLFE